MADRSNTCFEHLSASWLSDWKDIIQNHNVNIHISYQAGSFFQEKQGLK